MIEIKTMTLHNPLFLAGSNLGNKLDIKGRFNGLKLFYDPKHGRYVITFNGAGKFIHESNVADSEPINVADLGLDTTKDITPEVKTPPRVQTAGPAPMRKGIARTAQVGDPTRGNIG